MKLNSLLVAVLAAGILTACEKKENAPPPTPPPAAVKAASPAPGFEKLKGKWLRQDGGYILEIRAAATDGKLDAGYFNPSPIHVAKAKASRKGETVKVFIELQDVNYPGSTYTLTYDPSNDQLTGVYFQATSGQQYDIEFVRSQ
jgi:hypothetical protein